MLICSLFLTATIYFSPTPVICPYVEPVEVVERVSVASWYDYSLKSDKDYSKTHLTAASREYKRGTILKVTNVANGKWVIVRVNDWIEHPKRDIDLSSAAFKELAPLSRGLINVIIEEI